MNIAIDRSTIEDIDALIDVRNRSFQEDCVRYGDCPGYGHTRESMRRVIEDNHSYIIQCEGKTIGDISVRDRGDGRFSLGCLCVVPEYENIGIGSRAMAFLDEAFPQAVHWSLETPADKLRNHHFYEKHGYKITRRHKEGTVDVVRMERTRESAGNRKHLAGLCLTTKSVATLADFYCRVLETIAEGDDTHREIHTGGGSFAIYDDGQVSAQPGRNFYFTFDVENVDREHERLLALDVTVVQPPETQPWGMRNMVFLDPDGNRVVFRCKP